MLKKILLLCILCISSLVAQPLKKVTLQLQWKHQFEFAGFYAAKEMGYYEDAGIDVEFKEYDGDKPIIDSILDKDAQFGLVYSSLIAEYLQGKELVLIANYFKQSPLILIAQPEIKTPKELKNKKVMGVSDNIDSITLKLMLEKFGVFQDDIINLPTTFDIKDFIDKKVDAMAVFTTNEIYQLDKLGVKYNIFNPSLYGHEYYDVNLFTSKKFALQNPELVYKFKEASNKGWAYALENQSKIADLILKKYNSQHKTKDALLFEATQIEQIMFTKSEPIGSIDSLRVQLIAKNLIESGFADQNKLNTLDQLIFYYTNNTTKSKLTSKEQNYLKNNTITIGMVKDYYPFSYIEHNKINGFSYEYFKLLASKVNMNYDIQINNWSKTLNDFKENKIDIIDAISYTDKRTLFTNFTDPYFNIPNVIFTRKNSISNYTGLESLKNKKVGITKDIYYYDAINNLQLFDLVVYESSREKIKDLALGKIDAAFNNLTSGQKYIMQSGYSNIEVLDEINDTIIKKEDLRLGISKQDLTLFSIVQKASNMITPTEKLRLINKYFGPMKVNKNIVRADNTKTSQSIKKIAESISEYVWIYRPDLLVTSLKRWLDFFGFESAYFYDQELDEHTIVWRENGNLKHVTSSKKPMLNVYNDLENMKTAIKKDDKKLGDLTIFFKKHPPLTTLHFIEQEKQYLDGKNAISMCVDPDWEPYEHIDAKGNHVGIVAKFIKLIEDKIDKPITLVPTKTWSESLQYIKEGKCEILSFLNETPKRDEFLNFTDTLYSETEVIVAKDEVTYIDGFKDLENKTVGLVKGYRTEEYIKKNFPNIKIKYIRNYVEGIQLVSDGKIYATVNSLLGTAHLIKKHNFLDTKIAGRTALKNEYKIGVIKNDPLLHSILSKAVKSISQKEKDKIIAENITVKFENRIDYSLLFQIVIGAFILFLLFSYWTYKLKVENKKRLEAEKELKKLNLELEDRINEAIKEIQKKEKMLQHQNRLAQMGEMLSMIAHQWRQPIGAINSAVIAINFKINATKTKQQTNNTDNETFEYILKKSNNISNYIQFLSTTIDDFRNFFRVDKQKEQTSLNDVVENTLRIIESSIVSKRIKLIKSYNSNSDLQIYKNEMIQVVLNILQNAQDHLIDEKIEEPTIFITTYDNDKCHCIKICDNAGGIPDDIIEYIFDPYFSTKNEKNGTGLGLYMSKVIIEEHMKGKITAQNENGGACFLLELKRSNDE